MDINSPGPPASSPGPSPAPPLALYAHFPWCVKKCPYCDFNSHRKRGEIDQPAYIAALLRDLDYDLAHYPATRELSSIFLGGGTPSLFGGAAIAELLDGIRARLGLAGDIEITLEANPGGVEPGDFAAYRAAGVNRLSLGAQSFDDAQLRQLGRIHRAEDTAASLRAARDAGFTNINLDLMYGLPGQTTDAALRDCEAALELAPGHLSLYQLTIEPNTWFHRHPPSLPDDDRIMEIQTCLHRLVAARGYRRYEVAAHARPGMQCRHNLNYWRFGDYLGIGAGAHGKITRDGGILRYWKQKHPQRYLESAGGRRGIGATRKIADDEVLFEFLMNSLRLTGGFDTGLIRSRTGRDPGEVLELLAEPVARGLVLADHHRIRCGEKGYRFLDEILQQLLPG